MLLFVFEFEVGKCEIKLLKCMNVDIAIILLLALTYTFTEHMKARQSSRVLVCVDDYF